MLGRTHNEILDARLRQPAPATQRFCAATGAVKPVGEMIRFVVGPEGTVVPDLRGRLPGRGIWITSTRQALETAIARGAFTRGFKREVRQTADLVQNTERLLEHAALNALAMCHKAGRVAIGFAKVEAALAGARVVALLHAAEAASHGRRKLAAVLARRGDAPAIAAFDAFTTEQLDLALGRSNVVHAALLTGPESDTFVARTARLARFRTGPVTDPCRSGDYESGKSANAEMRVDVMITRLPRAGRPKT